MANKRTGLIARWLARRAGRIFAGTSPAPAVAGNAQERDAVAGTGPATPPSAAPSVSGGVAGSLPPAAERQESGKGATQDAASTAEPTPAPSFPDGPTDEGHRAPADPGDPQDSGAPASEAPAPDAPAADVPVESGELPQDDSGPGHGGPPEAAAPARDHPVITLVSLEEHAGAATVAAALARRTEASGWRIRTGGPGLLRAAFAGLLEDTDALVLVSPGDPATTATLDGKLSWFAANDRPGIPARTLVVVNLGAGDGGELVLPADLDRPVILLPFDAALGLPATGRPAPRRAARRALDQLVDELTTILEGAPNTTWHTTTSPSSDRDPETR